MAITPTIIFSIPQIDILNNSLQGVKTAIEHQPFWNTSLFGAILGSLLGLLPFAYLLYKDRPVIKVRARIIFVPALSGINKNQVRSGFSATIYNSGRRTVNIKNIYLKFVDGESLVFMSDSNFIGNYSGLPKLLGERDSHCVGILAGEVAESFLKKQCYPTFVCYEDALGKVYKCKTSEKFWDGVFAADGRDKSLFVQSKTLS